MRRLVLVFAVFGVLSGACAAPQTSGVPRYGYIAMGTADAALLGWVGSWLFCASVRSRAKGCDRLGLIGAAIAASAAGYGLANTEKPAETLDWVAVSLPVGLLLAAGVKALIPSDRESPEAVFGDHPWEAAVVERREAEQLLAEILASRAIDRSCTVREAWALDAIVRIDHSEPRSFGPVPSPEAPFCKLHQREDRRWVVTFRVRPD